MIYWKKQLKLSLDKEFTFKQPSPSQDSCSDTNQFSDPNIGYCHFPLDKKKASRENFNIDLLKFFRQLVFSILIKMSFSIQLNPSPDSCSTWNVSYTQYILCHCIIALILTMKELDDLTWLKNGEVVASRLELAPVLAFVDVADIEVSNVIPAHVRVIH